jgi:predicted acyltransferase
MTNRDESLDALRGFAILLMVLSGSIAHGDLLPSWMFHAQVPPPLYKFDPSIAGITWVDSVFPFFLFSMGAAIPLSLRKYINKGENFLFILTMAIKRFLLLAFFALFSQHMKAWVISDTPQTSDHLLSIAAFGLLFFQFYDAKHQKNQRLFLVLRVIAFAVSAFFLWYLDFWSGKGFDFYKSDIIIMVLANMALFGSIIYYLTFDKPIWRLSILPFIMAVFLAAKEPELGWAKTVYEFNHVGDFKFDWLYQFYFLKYLFIIIPGTICGEWLLANMLKSENSTSEDKIQISSQNEIGLSLTAFVLIIGNLYGLFERALFLNFLFSVVLCFLSYYLINKAPKENMYRKLILAGSYLLILGLSFEAYEGGIKKDHSTYSYYFVTSGLAFYTIICFSVWAKHRYVKSFINYLALNGKNPMVAYVAGSLLVLPLMSITMTKPYWDAMNQNIFMGLMKGIIFTGLVSLITIFFVKKKWFWKG